MNLHSIVSEFGLPVALIVFFVWRDYIREKTLRCRLNKVEDQLNEILIGLIKDSMRIISENNNLLAEIKDIFKQLINRESSCKENLNKLNSMIDKVTQVK